MEQEVMGSQEEARLALARAFYEALDAKPFDREPLEGLFAPSFVDHNRTDGEPGVSDRDAMIGFLSALPEGFPDAEHRIDLIEPVGEDRVLVYWRFTGTHTGKFLGVPPRGNPVDIAGTDLLRFAGGRIVEQWHVEELMRFFEQMGAA
jgi:predicted ester cyclase